MRILITGASGAIGLAAAKRLAAAGHELVLQTYRQEALLEQMIEEWTGKHQVLTANLAIEEDLQTFCAALPAVDAFVHAAGTSYSGLLIDQSAGSMEELWKLHVDAMMRISQFLTRLKPFDAPLAIVVISSVLGEQGAAGEVVYSTCKAAQLGFIKAYSKELGAMNGRINAITPGWIDTPMNAIFSDEEKSEAIAEIPAGRFGTAEEIASAIQYLIEPESAYVSGAILKIDGAWM
ncbi:elongation factor P 5-aminopentanone reductase [Exiguobacterium sp. TDN 0502]|uniref:elongation factor P 5-aminopentanone reductase n=1 Tax=Exiguobacterium sp. TDN 0502 TaxID=3420731 RepID=UPI003D76D938